MPLFLETPISQDPPIMSKFMLTDLTSQISRHSNGQVETGVIRKTWQNAYIPRSCQCGTLAVTINDLPFASFFGGV